MGKIQRTAPFSGKVPRMRFKLLVRYARCRHNLFSYAGKFKRIFAFLSLFIRKDMLMIPLPVCVPLPANNF